MVIVIVKHDSKGHTFFFFLGFSGNMASFFPSTASIISPSCVEGRGGRSLEEGRLPPDEGRLTPDGGRSREDGRDDMPYGEPHELAYVRTNPVCSAATRPVVHSRAWGRPSR